MSNDKEKGKQIISRPGKQIKHRNKFIHPGKNQLKPKKKHTSGKRNRNLIHLSTHTQRFFFVGALLPLGTSTTPLPTTAFNRVFSSVVGSNLSAPSSSPSPMQVLSSAASSIPMGQREQAWAFLEVGAWAGTVSAGMAEARKAGHRRWG